MSTPPPLPASSVPTHRQVVGTLSNCLFTLSELADAASLGAVGQRCRAVADRAVAQTFSVAFVGEFKRGKSTLINSLLGAEVLPADIAPCSATLNRVTYGEQPGATLRFVHTNGGAPPDQQISLDELASHVTQLTPQAAARASTIAEAVVTYPTSLCRDGVELVDTPGLNDTAGLTQVTLGVLPTVDAAVVVSSAQSPFSELEGELLGRLLSQDLGRVLFVVNRMDLVRSPADRTRILESVRSRILASVRERAQQLFPEDTERAEAFVAQLGAPRVFGMSAVDALEAQISGDADALEGSGFNAFSAALQAVLVQERGTITQGVLAATAASAAHTIGRQLALQRAALGIAPDDRLAAHHKASAQLAQAVSLLETELARLETARAALLDALRPRAKALSDRLTEEAEAAVVDCDTPSRWKSHQVGERLQQAVVDRLEQVLREESEALHRDIVTAVEEELGRTASFGRSLDIQLSQLEQDALAVATTGTLSERSSKIAAGTSLTASSLPAAQAASRVLLGSTVLWAGGALGGAGTGYQVAGAKGAAVGAAVGGVTTYAVSFASFAALSFALGITSFTMPIWLPVVVGSGLVGSWYASLTTQVIFNQEWFDTVREKVRASVREEMENGSLLRTIELEKQLSDQIGGVFGAISAQMREHGHAAISAARSTVDALASDGALPTDQTVERLRALDALDARLAEAVSAIGLAAG